MRVCLLHAGTHKTGTTSLQRLLGVNEQALSAAGLYIPKKGRPSQTGAEGAHHNVAWQLMGDPRFEPAMGTFADVVSEIEATGKPLALLSSEDFEYLHSRPAALRHVKQELHRSGFTLKVLLFLRRQDEYARSLYLELLHHGWRSTLDRYVAAILHDGLVLHRSSWIFQFSYRRLLNAFALIVGHKNILARIPVGPRPAAVSSWIFSTFWAVKVLISIFRS